MSVEALKNNEYSTEEGLFNLKKEINETINSTPEMNENEIKQLTGSQLHDIFLQSE
jgi:flagellar basal body-associated protein FliL